MENQNSFFKNSGLFNDDIENEKKFPDKIDKNLLNNILEKYFIKDMNDWKDVNADLIVMDPPFGIDFSGKNGNYNRNVKNVVDGYVEWKVDEYGKRIQQLLECIKNNLKSTGQALIFSGWNNSNVIHDRITEFKGLTLRGKLYWIYNFAPVCRVKPSHNVYEIYWVTKGENGHITIDVQLITAKMENPIFQL